jgi:ABC-2 type transport system ATP-binding protein
MKAPPAIHIQRLRFSFSKEPLLFDNLALRIPQGGVFGILGPNGAGKSTLIKIALGLIPHYEGTIKLFGKNHHQHRKAILERIGFLLEGPRVYPHLSGLDNLEVWATYRGLELQQSNKLLEEVGLTPHAHKLVRHYSTGLRQRLAIAMALLHDPALLILDEPTNGLDPQGIAEIRQLIRQLRTEPERTIILCSHILSEVQQVCDEVSILYQGQIVFQGKVADIERSSGQYVVETDNPLQAEELLRERTNWPVEQRRTDILLELPDRNSVDELIQLLRDARIRIFQIRRLESDLEQTYLQALK